MTMTRNLTAFIAIAAVALAILFGLWRWQESRLAATFATGHFATSHAAQKLIEGQRADNLASRAELLVGNQAFVGYMQLALGGALPGMSVDTSSIVDQLEERRDQLGLAVAAVLDGQGHLVVGTERFSDGRELGAEPLFVRARQSVTPTTGLWPDGDRLLHVAIVPLAADGSSDGFLLVGTQVDQTLAQSVANVAGIDAALLATTAAGATVMGSTLDAAIEKALASAFSTGQKRGATPFDTVLAGRRFRIVATPLFGSGDARLLSLVSDDRIASSSGALGLPWLIAALAVLAFLAGVAAWVWTQLLRPSQALADLLERSGGGDFHLSAVEQGAPPFVRLAAAFNVLMQRLQGR